MDKFFIKFCFQLFGIIFVGHTVTIHKIVGTYESEYLAVSI